MKMATNGVELEIEVAESKIRSGGRRLISNGPFIGSLYRLIILPPFDATAPSRRGPSKAGPGYP